MKYLFVKTLSGLRPIDDGCKAYNRLKVGESTELDIVTPRNAKFHRLFFALLNLAYENQELYKSMKHFRKDLIKAAGFYHEEMNHFTGKMELEADSISFSKMDEIEFKEVYDRVLDVIWNLLGGEKQAIIDELLRFN